MARHSSNQMRNVSLAKLQCRGQWSRTYAAGRTCSHPGCGTPLSKYNPDPTCYPHRPEPDPLRFHGMSFVLCPGCGAVLAAPTGGRRGKAADRTCNECRYATEVLP